MIFWQLFLTFCKIGIVNFGGGYAMITLIQHEVVEKHQWLSATEFTDIVATSQMTPGPIGINVATYAGYTAVINEGYSQFWGIIGALLSSFAVILLPFLLVLLLTGLLTKYYKHKKIENILKVLRITVIGLIAAAALLLMNSENFGNFNTNSFHFCMSLFIFLATFIASAFFKISPILLIIISGFIGFILY